MIGVFVTFAYPDGIDRGRVQKIADEAGPNFKGVPGLRSKAFTLDEANRRATNFYVWDDEDAARGFFNDALKERVTGLYGVAPQIDFVDVVGLVENT